jgi:CDP-diglyceride synthetase
MLAWTHMGMLFLCVPGHLMNMATLSGMIWYVVPMSVITINDIAAYMVGFFFGKTQLIKVSGQLMTNNLA